ncbi:hypothetical protein [Flavobacterium sp.]|uniref:hypothetical protein n=1 Tax=Flavobacterium sp. TaxID=239 RepID=UPI002634207A|nr:hypothetical protein [Flavobacterium sp.]
MNKKLNFKNYSILIISYLFANFSFSQSLNLANEKEIIKQTLNQYLDNNPNSISSMLKGSEAYKMLSELVEFGISIDTLKTEEMKRQEYKRVMEKPNIFSDSISNLLLTKKITVKIVDTLFAYKYLPTNHNLKNKMEWDSISKILLVDFKKEKIKIDFIDLINKQIHNKYKDIYISPSEFNNSYFQYEKRTETKCDNDFCINAYKVYHLMLNSNQTKGCYLFSYNCNNGTCREFIFIEKVKNKWQFVSSYQSSIIDEW